MRQIASSFVSSEDRKTVTKMRKAQILREREGERARAKQELLESDWKYSQARARTRGRREGNEHSYERFISGYFTAAIEARRPAHCSRDSRRQRRLISRSYQSGTCSVYQLSAEKKSYFVAVLTRPAEMQRIGILNVRIYWYVTEK